MAIRLLLVDHDDAHRADLAARLTDDGFDVAAAGDRAQAMALADRALPHLALCDLHLPDGSAERLARDLNRLGDVRVVVVAACASPVARARAIERFAEDFVVRPYLYDELLARIRRILRGALVSDGVTDERLALAPDVWLDRRRRVVHRGGETDRLTPTEARLLDLFLANSGRLLPTDLILQRVWTESPPGANTLWEFVRRLRRKLGDDADRRLIVSERGVGYEFRKT